MSDTPLAVRFAQEVMQKYSYEPGDLPNRYRPEELVFCLAVMKSTLRALEPHLDGTDTRLLKILDERTTAVLMPTALDPRRRSDG